MMSSTDSGHGFSLCTPKRVEKQLFRLSGTSSKRNLFQTKNMTRQNDASSGDESDLGPMSPLDITDNSANESSPGREYDSPFTTPEKSPTVLGLTWDRLRLNSSSQKSSGLSPFSSLKKLTRDARSSPRRKMFPNSLRTSICSPGKKNVNNYVPVSPTQTELESFMSDIVPETPQKDRIGDTPQKENFSERRLITPLGSVCKEIVVPPLHRRKSSCPFDSSEESSPERKSHLIKGHMNDSSSIGNTKLNKTDEGYASSRARASLFQDEGNNVPKLTTLSTKSFYNQTNGTKRHSFGLGWRPLEILATKRHSLPSNPHHRRSTGLAKRQKFGEINAGVRHGIKRPRPKKKRHSSATPPRSNNQSISETKENILADENITLPVTVLKPISLPPLPRPPSPVGDPNKRFFKTNRTVQTQHAATVTVNGNIKLKVSEGKFALHRKKGPIRHVNKKPKLDHVPFDTTDLTVGDPSFDASLNQNDVAGILKVLEDDWADDEYDTLEPLIVARSNSQSPSKSANIANNILLSPASVLSTMTSSMNIKDQNGLQNIKADTASSDSNQESNSNTRKVFPLFIKGYTSKMIGNSDGRRGRGVKRPASWQLSTKTNGGSEQFQLDAGQKRFGTTQCNECGVVYQIGEPEDENTHLVFHNSVKSLKFNGWKNERIVYQDPFTGNRVITIEASDPKHHWKKVEEVLGVVDRDLGLTDMKLSDFRNKRIYFYVADKSIIGVLVAESVTIAHRMIPEFFELNCCSEESTPVKCGVNVIWTALSHRRKGIARKLLDILRSNYFYGYIMTLDEIAFSIPTPSGKIFAEKYTGSRNFKVYSDQIDTSS